MLGQALRGPIDADLEVRPTRLRRIPSAGSETGASVVFPRSNGTKNRRGSVGEQCRMIRLTPDGHSTRRPARARALDGLLPPRWRVRRARRRVERCTAGTTFGSQKYRLQRPAALVLGRTLFGPTPPQTPFGPASRTKCLLGNKDRPSFFTENNIIAYDTTT